MCEFQVGIKVIKFIKKRSKLFFSISPCKKYVVNIIEPTETCNS